MFKNNNSINVKPNNPEEGSDKKNRCKPIKILIDKYKKLRHLLKDFFPRRVRQTKQENKKGSKF